MIPAKPTILGRFFWKNFVRLAMKRAFHDIALEGIDRPPESSVLLLGNHISWWDGFFALYLNEKLFHKQYYVMMLEQELKKHRFMRQGGAFSIRPGSRSVVQSLTYTQALLRDPRNLVTIFPQGKIHSQYDREVHFQPGIGKMLDRMESNIQIIFYAAHLDYGAHAKPTLHFRLKYFSPQKGSYEEELEKAYRAHFLEALSSQIARFPI